MKKKSIPTMSDMESFESLLALFDSADETEEDYLHRGERLLSLAKEKLYKLENKLKSMESAQQILFEMDFKDGKFSDKDCFMKIRLIARKYLRLFKESPEEAAKKIYDLTDGICMVSSYEDSDYWLRYVARKTSCVDDDVLLTLEVKDGDTIIHTAHGLRDTIVPLDKPMWLFSGLFLCEDLSSIIAYCAMYGAVRSVLRDKYKEDNEIYQNFIASVNEDIAKNKILENLPRRLGEKLRREFLDIVPNKFYETAREVLTELRDSGRISDLNYVFYEKDNVPDYYRDVFSLVDGVVSLTGKTEYEVKEENNGKWGEILYENLPKESVKSFVRQVMYKCVVPIRWKDFDCYDFPVKYWQFFCRDCSVLPPISMAFVETLSYSGGHLVTRFISGLHYCSRGSWIVDAFKYLYEEKHSIVEQYRSYKKSSSDYALSFMDKKNIPKKTIEAMKASELNKYFGYVEYDEDVDLAKVGIVEKEFEQFKDTYLKEIDSTKNAIRFRKLGNHKASGLYYPGAKCLCVDFRYPTSFVHEYGHLIDYELGNLSIKTEFHKIRSLFKEHLMKLPKNTRKDMKGKYNMDYYLQPTEVFARSFELYVRYSLNVDNDLLPKEFGAVYPVENEEFLNEVTAYFNAVLKININKEVEKDEAA